MFNIFFRLILFFISICSDAHYQELNTWKKFYQQGSLHYQHWDDLPKQPLQILPETENNIKLNNLITQYHTLKKNSDNLLQKRLIALEKIIAELAILLPKSHNKALKHQINDLKYLAIGKKNYLAHLLKLQSQNLHKLQKEIKNPSLILNKYKPIFLLDNARYDVAKEKYWGEYQFEALDPCHRELTHYILKWRQQTGCKDYFSLKFFLWLETKYVPKKTRVSMSLTNQEIENFQVIAKDSLLYDISGLLADFSDPHVEYIFVIDYQGRLLITSADKFIHHTSLSQWKPVIGCGAIKIKQGKMQEISFESGHYLPSPTAAVQTFIYLKNLGIKLAKKTPVTYFTPAGKQKLPLDKFLQCYDKKSRQRLNLVSSLFY